jgi:hypothetical protein
MTSPRILDDVELGPLFAATAARAHLDLGSGTRWLYLDRHAGANDPEPPLRRVILASIDWLAARGVPVAELRSVTLALTVTEYCIEASSRFVEHCLEEPRRRAPFASLQMEPTHLLRRLIRSGSWAGPCFTFIACDQQVNASFSWATEVVASGQLAQAIVGDIRYSPVGALATGQPVFNCGTGRRQS